MKKKLIKGIASCIGLVLVVALCLGMAPGGGGGSMGGGMGGGPGGQGGGEAEETTKQTVVETQTPTTGNIIVTGEFVGTVEPGQQVTIYPKVSGEVLNTYFKVGDTVNMGDVLLTLDSTDVQFSIAQTQASLATAEAKAELNLKMAEKELLNYEANLEDGYNSSLLSAEGNVNTAENALQKANADVLSARRTYVNAVNGDSDMDYSDDEITSLREARLKAELAQETAQLNLEQARANLEAVKTQTTQQAETVSDNVALAEINGNMEEQRISLAKLQSNLNDYNVTSHISGVVEQCNVDPYDMINTSTSAYVISNKEAMTVSFSVSEGSLDYLKLADKVTIKKNDETCEGYISEISNMVDSSTGLYTIKATVENAPFELRSGSIIKLIVDTQKVENETLIPIDALYYDNGSPYIFVFKDGAANRRDIETGISNATDIQVTSGLSLSDEVIVTWSSSLYDGVEVYLPGTTPSSTDEATSEEASPPVEAEEAAA